jgi:hypothetical protein
MEDSYGLDLTLGGLVGNRSFDLASAQPARLAREVQAAAVLVALEVFP